MKNVKITLFLTLIATFVFYASCDDESSGPAAFTLSTLTAGGIDLNAATSATNVPVDSDIIATFSTAVDESTAADNFVLTREYDGAEISFSINVDGNTVTLTPANDFGQGSLYELEIKSGLKSTEGVAFQGVTRTFTTEGSFAPAGVIAHFNFESNIDDQVGSYTPAASDITDVTYVASRNAAAGKAASFNGTTSIAEIPNADDFLSYGDITVSFWVKANTSSGKGHFVLGLAAWYGFQFEIPGDYTWVKMAMRYAINGGTEAEDSWYPGNGETKDNIGWQGWTVNKDVSASGGVGDTYFKDKWAHVVVTYDAATKINNMYINGELVKQHDFNLWPDDSPKKNITGVTFAGNAAGNKLALGFIQGSQDRIVGDEWADPANPDNNHFMGELDDLRVFDHAITAQEVTLMYDSEK